MKSSTRDRSIGCAVLCSALPRITRHSIPFHYAMSCLIAFTAQDSFILRSYNFLHSLDIFYSNHFFHVGGSSSSSSSKERSPAERCRFQKFRFPTDNHMLPGTCVCVCVCVCSHFTNLTNHQLSIRRNHHWF